VDVGLVFGEDGNLLPLLGIVKEDKMGRVCSMNGETRSRIRLLMGKL
jgi:hypothetical protein